MIEKIEEPYSLNTQKEIFYHIIFENIRTHLKKYIEKSVSIFF